MHDICAYTCSSTPIAILADFFRSLDEFYKRVKEIKIRPYLRIYTTEEMESYKKMLIGTMAILKEAQLNTKNPTKEQEELLKNLFDEIKNFFKEFQQIHQQESYEFNEFCSNILVFLKSTREVLANIPNLWNEKNTKEYENILNFTQKVIEGEKPTPEILNHLLQEINTSISEYPQKIVSAQKTAKDPNLTKFVSLIKGIQQYLQKTLQNQAFKPREIEALRAMLVWYKRQMPQLTGTIREHSSTKKLMNYFTDLINLTRQMQMPSSIDYVGETIVPIESSDIAVIANHMSKQFSAMEYVCYELSLNPIIQDSLRLNDLVKRVYNFFKPYNNVLKTNIKTLENTLGDFCNEIEPQLNKMVKLLTLLHPILTDSQLIDSVKAIQLTVNNVIKLYDKHHLTSMQIEKFRNQTLIIIQKLAQLIQQNITKEIINAQKQGGLFAQEILQLIKTLPQNVETMNSDSIVEWCDKIYTEISSKVPQIRTELDPSHIMPLLYKLYADLYIFSSIENKVTLYLSDSLLLRASIFPLDQMVNLYTYLLQTVPNPNAFPNELNISINSIYQSVLSQTQNIQSSNIFFTNVLQSSQQELESHPFEKCSILTRYVAVLIQDISRKISSLQNLALVCSMKICQIIEEMRKHIDNIPLNTIYQNQFINQIKQIDTTMVSKNMNMTSVAFTYTPLHLISQLAQLTLVDDPSFNQLLNAYNELLFAEDSSLSSAIIDILAMILNFVEQNHIFSDFVEQLADIIRENPFIHASFDQVFMSNISRIYLKFASQNGEMIASKASMGDQTYQTLKFLMDMIEIFNPIIQKWIQPSAAMQDSSLKRILHAMLIIAQNSINDIKSGNILLPYCKLRYILKTIIVNITSANDFNVDTQVYDEIIKELSQNIDLCDEYSFAYSNGSQNSEKLLLTSLQKVNSSLNSLKTACGEIPAYVEEFPIQEQEEEEEHHEEEIIDYVSIPETWDKIINIVINTQQQADIQELLSLSTDLVKSIQHFNTQTGLLQPLEQFINDQNIQELVSYITKSLFEENEKKFNVECSTIDEINHKFVETTDKIREVQSQINNPSEFSQNSEKLIRELVVLCSNSQILAVSTISIFNYVSNDIFTFFLQTIQQLWSSLSTLLNNLPSNGQNDDYSPAIKNQVRSIVRLSSELSYLVEDSLLQEKPQTSKPIDINKTNFSLSLSQAIKKSAETLKIIALSTFKELLSYNIHTILQPEDPNNAFDSPFQKLETIIQQLNSQNVKQEFTQQCNDSFKQSYNQYFLIKQQFLLIDQTNTPPLTIELLSQCIKDNQKLYEMFSNLSEIVSQMSDVIERKPDIESSKLLEERFSIPSITRIPEGLTIEQINSQMTAQVFPSLEASIKYVESILFGSNEKDKKSNAMFTICIHSNQKVVEAANNFKEIAKALINYTMYASIATPYVEHQTALTELITDISSNVNDVLKGIRHLFLCQSDWETICDNGLDSIAKNSEKIKQTIFESCEMNRTKNAEYDKLSKQYNEIAKPFVTMQTEIKGKVTEIEELSPSLQREYGLSLSDICKSTCSTFVKVIMFLKDHQDFMVTNTETLAQYMQAISHNIGEAINVITFVSTTVESEDHLSASSKVISKLIETFLSLFKSGKETQIFINTLNDIKKASEELAQAAENSKKARTQPKPPKPTNSLVPTDYLLNLIRLEAAIIKARLSVREQEKIVEYYNNLQ